MSETTLIATVHSTKRIKNSTYGNPRYEVTLTRSDGTLEARKTAANSMQAYAVGNKTNGLRDGERCVFTINGRGTIESWEQLNG